MFRAIWRCSCAKSLLVQLEGLFPLLTAGCLADDVRFDESSQRESELEPDICCHSEVGVCNGFFTEEQWAGWQAA